jgi:hypothetical protein
MLLTSGDASDSKDSSEDDGKPQIHMNPSKSKNQWSAADVQWSISRSLRILQNRRKEAPLRVLKLPESIDWLKPEVMKGKTLEDAEARANMAGTCGFSALTCLKTSRAHALKIDALCKALPPLTGDPKEDVTAMKAWTDSIRAKAKEWLYHIQVRWDAGAKLAAALFSKETQFIRQEVAKAPRLAPAKSILLGDSLIFRQTTRSARPWKLLTSTVLPFPSLPTMVVAAASHGERALRGRHLPIKGRNRSSARRRTRASSTQSRRETP